METRELLNEYGFDGDNAPFVRGSATKALAADSADHPDAQCVIELMGHVDSYIVEPERDLGKPFVLPIEDVFSIQGRGTVVTGRIEQGTIKIGDKVEILGLKTKGETDTVVIGVEMFHKQMETAQAGDNVGLLLRGISRDGVQKGQVLAIPGTVQPHSKFVAEVLVLTKEEGGRHSPFESGYAPSFFFRTTSVTGVVQLPDSMKMALPGDRVTGMKIELESPVAMVENLRFAIREGGKTVGAGFVKEILN
jgi:elongation factor Tu